MLSTVNGTDENNQYLRGVLGILEVALAFTYFCYQKRQESLTETNRLYGKLTVQTKGIVVLFS